MVRQLKTVVIYKKLLTTGSATQNAEMHTMASERGAKAHSQKKEFPHFSCKTKRWKTVVKNLNY